MMFKELVERTRPPRSLLVKFPFGRPFGEPGNYDAHRVILEDALHIIEAGSTPGMVIAAPYKWRREDYGKILAERSKIIAH